MRTKLPEPEILLPRSQRGSAIFTDETLDHLSHILDDFLRIPGTQIRFGLDGIVGLIPGIGDVLGAMASWIIVLAAWMRGVSKVTLARMLANIAIETVIGAVPIIGDAFDIAWKANRRNFALLQRAKESGNQGTSRDWLFLLLLIVCMMALLAIPLLVLAWIAHKLLSLGAHR